MRITPIFLTVFLSSCLFGLVSCSADSGLSSQDVSVQKVSLSGESTKGSLTDRFFAETNSYRATKGKAPLVRNSGLDKLAASHARYLANHRGEFDLYGSDVSHYGFEGRAMQAKVSLGIPSVGENVVSGTSSPAGLVSSLSRSANHDHAMLSDWHSVGVAVVEASDGRRFGVQMFGTYPSLNQSWRFQRH